MSGIIFPSRNSISWSELQEHGVLLMSRGTDGWLMAFLLLSELLSSFPFAHCALPSSFPAQKFSPALLARNTLPAASGWLLIIPMLALRPFLPKGYPWTSSRGDHPTLSLVYFLHLINHCLCYLIYLFVHLFIVCLSPRRIWAPWLF